LINHDLLPFATSTWTGHTINQPYKRMLSGYDVDLWNPFRKFRTWTGYGVGLAACPSLGLLVTSEKDYNTLSVWGMPEGGVCDDGGLRLMFTLGGAGSVGPMQFKFDGMMTGHMAFTPTISTRPLLVVTDYGHDAVHIVDVVDSIHVGYVASPGSSCGPRGVAASETLPLVAVSTCKHVDSGDHVVTLYKGNGVVWEVERIIGGGFGRPGPRDGQMRRPNGLRFSRDGCVVCVADWYNNRASMFRVDNGEFVRHLATSLGGPMDVEEMEGGWLVACAYPSHNVVFVDNGTGGGRRTLGRYGTFDGEFCYPQALATVPGLGLVVRDTERVQVFSTPDTIAMLTNMSVIRSAWMCAVARSVLRKGGCLRGCRCRQRW
jgi:hypothetical protein